MKNQPKEVFTAFRQSMLAKSDAWMDLIAEDVHLKGPLAEVHGKAAFIEINKPFFDSIQSSEIRQIVESQGYIITRISTVITAPTGKSLSLAVSEWYEIKDNLIQSLTVYFDTAELRNEIASLD